LTEARHVKAIRGGGSENLSRDNLGFLLAKSAQRWNELLYERFRAHGYAEVRPSYGSLLLPLFEEDALRMGELARRARLSKQTMTTMVRLLERDGLVERRPDPSDGRATVIVLTARGRSFRPVAEAVLAEMEMLAATVLADEQIPRLKAALRALISLDP
jgi:DNA-binding MarR family transcriptional regulator